MWDSEFTESKPLDDTTQEELAVSGDKAFTTLYQCLLAHAANQQQSAGRDGASEVTLIRPRNTLSFAPENTNTQIIKTV